MRKWTIIAALALIAGIGVFAWTNRESSAGLLRPNDAALVALGASLYAEYCASCHGANLEGEPNWRRPKPDGLMPAPPHDETGHTWHHTDDVLIGITKVGVAEFSGQTNYRSAMPIYKDILTDDEIIAVLSFIKAQWPEQLRRRHDEMNALDK